MKGILSLVIIVIIALGRHIIVDCEPVNGKLTVDNHYSTSVKMSDNLPHAALTACTTRFAALSTIVLASLP